ncbi:MAG TPA: CoA transferase [Acidimicrobiales bacterium]|nr:CoA transferase [Acidimicrobiales bacterium]
MTTAPPAKSTALSHIRICDFTGQLAGAGATRWLAALGAQVIRIEDPVRQGKWDILRGSEPYKDDRRGIEFGGGFQNHNVEKLGITLNLRTDRGKELLRQLVEISDVVSENFAAGVLERWGFDYPALRAIKDDIIYVSNCGFGHTGPYRGFRTWGPIVQAACGLTFSSGLPGLPPAGWGYSYMDHHGGNIMAIAILCALVHHQRTGEGQWVDMSCTEAGASLLGPVVLDYTVNGRPLRRAGMPNSNRSQFPPMAPHGIYACNGDDDWVAVSCRDDHDWVRMGEVIDQPWCGDDRYATLVGRLEHEDELDLAIDVVTRSWNKFDLAARLQAVGVPAAAVQKPAERIDADVNTAAWGLWPTVHHREMGEVRVDGEPVHMSETDWVIARGSPCLGEHNDQVFGELLGMTSSQIDDLRTEGII